MEAQTFHKNASNTLIFNRDLLIFRYRFASWKETLCAAIYWCLIELLGFFQSGGQLRPHLEGTCLSETDARRVRGHLGPLMQIKDEKWRTTEMNKPLKWFQGWTAQSETDQHHSGMRAMTGWLITQKDRKEAACKSDHSDNTGLKSHSQWFQMLFYCKFKVIFSFTGIVLTCDGPTLKVDVLRGVLLVSSLCSPCSSATRSAQTCFSPPPLNSLLSERGQRPGTVTYPGGGWRISPLALYPERWAVLYFVYTWVSYSLLDQLTECRKSCCIQFPALFLIVRTDQ